MSVNEEYFEPSVKNINVELKHYYGHYTRRLLLAAALIIILGIPTFQDHVSFPLVFSVIAVLVVTLAAGFTNPRHKFVLLTDCTISTIGLLIFSYQAIITFKSSVDFLYTSNQILALIFLFATYFSAKTLRNFYAKLNDIK